MLLQVTTEAITGTGPNWTVIITAISSIIGTGGLLKWYNAYTLNKKIKRDDRNAYGIEYKESLKSQVSDLEDKVDFLTQRIEEIITSYNEKILKLSTDNARFKTENNLLKEDNEELKDEIKGLKV